MIYSINGREVDPQSTHYKLLETIRTDKKIALYVDGRIHGDGEIQEEYEAYYTQAKELGKEYWQPEMMPKLPGNWSLYYLCMAKHNPNMQTEAVIKHLTYSEERPAPKTRGALISSLSGIVGTSVLAALAQRFGVSRLIALARRLPTR